MFLAMLSGVRTRWPSQPFTSVPSPTATSTSSTSKASRTSSSFTKLFRKLFQEIWRSLTICRDEASFTKFRIKDWRKFWVKCRSMNRHWLLLRWDCFLSLLISNIKINFEYWNLKVLGQCTESIKFNVGTLQLVPSFFLLCLANGEFFTHSPLLWVFCSPSISLSCYLSRFNLFDICWVAFPIFSFYYSCSKLSTLCKVAAGHFRPKLSKSSVSLFHFYKATTITFDDNIQQFSLPSTFAGQPSYNSFNEHSCTMEKKKKKLEIF